MLVFHAKIIVDKFYFMSPSSQVVCLLPVGIFNHVMFIASFLSSFGLTGPEKSHWEWSTKIFIYLFISCSHRIYRIKTRCSWFLETLFDTCPRVRNVTLIMFESWFYNRVFFTVKIPLSFPWWPWRSERVSEWASKHACLPYQSDCSYYHWPIKLSLLAVQSSREDLNLIWETPSLFFY